MWLWCFFFILIKISSWNVNSVRARIENIKEYIKQPLSKNGFNSLNYIRFEDDLETVPSFYAKNWNQISSELKKLKSIRESII